MERFKIISKNKIDTLPKTTGVYCFIEKKKTMYIGKAINIKYRVKNHFNGKYWWEKALRRSVSSGRIGFIKTNSEIEALILEASLIKKQQPRFNVVWKDDKNYFYVALTKNKNNIPYLFITHQKNHQKTEYIGPFVDGAALKKTLRFLRKVFPYYTAKNHPKNNCTYCHLNLCPGPYDKEAIQQGLEAKNGDSFLEYKKNIRKLILILKGKRNTVLNSLKKEMKQLSKENKFEKAGKIRDRIYNLQQVMSHKGVISQELPRELFLRNSLKTVLVQSAKILQKLAGTNQLVSRIECYDVSNINGKHATGSMITFINGQPKKSQYKKFKINMKNEPNDIAMLKEIIKRRLLHKEWPYPEIMLIDGGIAQLNIAISVKNQNTETKRIKVISIAKRNKKLYIEGKKQPILLKSLPQEIFNLILQLDDEAHKFAIAYHKKLRKKTFFSLA